MRVGVFTDGLGHLPLDAALDWLAAELPEVKDLEIGTGGFSATPHCDVDSLLADLGAARAWLAEIEERVRKAGGEIVARVGDWCGLAGRAVDRIGGASRSRWRSRSGDRQCDATI